MEEEFGVVRLEIEGVVVRYVVEFHSIDITFEGFVEAQFQDMVVEDLQDKLTRLENHKCRTRWLRVRTL